jgi:hypothetical protein
LLEFSVDALVLHYQLPGDKVLGLAKNNLGIGVPGSAKDFFNQVESLALFESKRQVLFVKIYNFSSALLRFPFFFSFHFSLVSSLLIS